MAQWTAKFVVMADVTPARGGHRAEGRRDSIVDRARALHAREALLKQRMHELETVEGQIAQLNGRSESGRQPGPTAAHLGSSNGLGTSAGLSTPSAVLEGRAAGTGRAGSLLARRGLESPTLPAGIVDDGGALVSTGTAGATEKAGVSPDAIRDLDVGELEGMSLSELQDRLEAERKEADVLEQTLGDARTKLGRRKEQVTASVDSRRTRLSRLRTELNTLHARRLSELAAAAANLQLREQQYFSLVEASKRGEGDLAGRTTKLTALERQIESLLEQLRVADAEAAELHRRLAVLALRDKAEAATTAAAQHATPASAHTPASMMPAAEGAPTQTLAQAAAAAEERARAAATLPPEDPTVGRYLARDLSGSMVAGVDALTAAGPRSAVARPPGTVPDSGPRAASHDVTVAQLYRTTNGWWDPAAGSPGGMYGDYHSGTPGASHLPVASVAPTPQPHPSQSLQVSRLFGATAESMAPPRPAQATPAVREVFL